MTLYVKRSSLSYDYDEASRADRLRDRGWVECDNEACGRGHNMRMGPPHAHQSECTYCRCPDCVDGLIPPDGMIEAAAKGMWPDEHWLFDDDPKMLGARLAKARAALVEAARWEKE